MITLICCPKPFRGHSKIIQRNAIRSWTLLESRPEIILMGDEEGTDDVAADFGIRQVKGVERNEYGTPLLNSLFATAEKIARHGLLCYLNADIILLSDFAQVVGQIHKLNSKFLAVGYRWDVEIEEELDFQQSDWEARLRKHVSRTGRYPRSAGSDYFIFPRGLWDYVPPFALGRGYWNSWLVYRARAMHIPVIDATPVLKVIHQKHDYSHISRKESGLWYGAEAKRNERLSGGIRHAFDIKDATYLLTNSGLKPARERKRRLRLLFTSVILATERSPYLFPCVWIIDALLWLREVARSLLEGEPHERKMRLWQKYARFDS